MSVTVTIAGGNDRTISGGADFDLDEGNLIVVDGNGDNVAAYAPGVWQSAEVVTS